MPITKPAWMNGEYAILRESIKKFIASEVAPFYTAWEEEGVVPREIWYKLGKQGFLAPDIPEEYGGVGGRDEHLVVVIAEFARHGYATIASSMISVHSGIVIHYILNNGSEAQKRRYLPAMASGDMVAALAMTEPAAGSDLQGIKTTAKRDGNGYILNGSKTFISNGQHCDVVVVVAKTDTNVSGAKGTSLLFVECDNDGFRRGRNLDKIGLRSSDTSELFFDNVRIDGDAVLGPEHGGFAVMMNELPRERLTLAIVGLAPYNGRSIMSRSGKPLARQSPNFRIPASRLLK